MCIYIHMYIYIYTLQCEKYMNSIKSRSNSLCLSMCCICLCLACFSLPRLFRIFTIVKCLVCELVGTFESLSHVPRRTYRKRRPSLAGPSLVGMGPLPLGPGLEVQNLDPIRGFFASRSGDLGGEVRVLVWGWVVPTPNPSKKGPKAKKPGIRSTPPNQRKIGEETPGIRSTPPNQRKIGEETPGIRSTPPNPRKFEGGGGFSAAVVRGREARLLKMMHRGRNVSAGAPRRREARGVPKMGQNRAEPGEMGAPKMEEMKAVQDGSWPR